jgi:hypothetical protein
MTTSTIQVVVRVLVFAVLSTTGMLANPIFVSNVSFENVPIGGLTSDGCGTGCHYDTAAIPNWTNSGTSGQFQPGAPTNTAYFNTLSDGPTSAYTNGADIFGCERNTTRRKLLGSTDGWLLDHRVGSFHRWAYQFWPDHDRSEKTCWSHSGQFR